MEKNYTGGAYSFLESGAREEEKKKKKEVLS